MNGFVKAVVGVLLAFGLSSAANAATRTGVLRCYVAPGPGFVVGSVHDARCVFRSNVTGRREYYLGRISRIGVDIGYTGPAVLVWAVYAPSALCCRALTGNYIGATADAAIGVGGGANVLVGGNAATISLQPISFQAETGLAVGAGAGALQLR